MTVTLDYPLGGGQLLQAHGAAGVHLLRGDPDLRAQAAARLARRIDHHFPAGGGGGIGAALLTALIDRARALGKHVMVAGIAAENTGSIRLHERMGFRQTGHLPQVGAKFGRWLDLAFLQLVLDDRAAPDA